jgi:hypothetical protein
MECLVEDIDEIPEDSEVSYEVWALGYAADNTYTGVEVQLGTFEDPHEAETCASRLAADDISQVLENLAVAYEYDVVKTVEEAVAYFSIEVETVVEDSETGDMMNIGTIYRRQLNIK